ncbi:MAG: hypothetical protein SFU56_07690 [Capsulimonadales bacterium]|nr:hypothetical protein [Capsulimonadales bacterium]
MLGNGLIAPFNRPDFFPLAVWLQSPANAARYRAAGVNLYVGLWEGPTENQLAALKAARMPVICHRNAVGIAHAKDPMIAGWLQDDEPDNAQPVTDPKTGRKGYGPCVPPSEVVSRYRRLKEADTTRPVLLNLGQGVANDRWIGRGPGAKLDDYRTYVQGGDIVSFDVYPIATGLPLRTLTTGIDRLVAWTDGKKPIWNCVECSAIQGTGKVTPRQLRAEIWLSITHGSRGLIYFTHQFAPKFNEHAILDDPPLLAEWTATNRRIAELAPVLNRPTIAGVATAVPDPPDTPIDFMVKQHDGWTYLFAVGMPERTARVRWTIRGLPQRAVADVIGESRSIPVQAGTFTDDFQTEDVHLYRLR